MPGGRPSKFSNEMQGRIRLLAERGFTDKEICKAVDVPERTLNNWKNRHPEFWQSLKEWKSRADEKVERSLYERACGYSHPEDKIFCNNGEVIVESTTKHYPPDTTAAIFWLKNRNPEAWRDRSVVEHKGRLDHVHHMTDEELDEAIGELEDIEKTDE